VLNDLTRSCEIEIILLGESTLVDVMLVFESFPVWLAGLEPSRFGKIQLSGFENKESFLASLDPNIQLGDFVDRILHRLGPTRVSITESRTSRPSPNCLVLISGSLQYIALVVDWFSMSGNVIGVVDHHFHGRLRNGRPSGISVSSMLGGAVWTRVRHESVGGVTKFVGLFCSSMNLDPTVSTLQRTLNHIVDFSLRPRCIRDSDDRFTSALTLQQRLYPGNLEQFIVYPTHFCCTGFGYRSLTPNELAHAFGLPMSICVGGLCIAVFMQLLPVQLLHSVLDSGSFGSTRITPTLPVATMQNRLPMYRFPCSSRSWIGAVGRWLSHAWIDTTQVTTKAAKRDDASIAIDMCDQRLLLLYPRCTPRMLANLRNWLLSFCRRLILRGLR
jgi:hypothetical protein